MANLNVNPNPRTGFGNGREAKELNKKFPRLHSFASIPLQTAPALSRETIGTARTVRQKRCAPKSSTLTCSLIEHLQKTSRRQ